MMIFFFSFLDLSVSLLAGLRGHTTNRKELNIMFLFCFFMYN